MRVKHLSRHLSRRQQLETSPGAFEILDGPLVLLGGGSTLECSEISALARFRIFLSRVEPIFSGFQLPDHLIQF